MSDAATHDSTVRTVADLVERFGGTAKCAAWAQVQPSVISNWKARGHIPGAFQLRFYLEAQRRRIAIADDLFVIGD